MDTPPQSKRTGPGHNGGPKRGVARLESGPPPTPGEFTLVADWRTGPRTRTWEELWRWLLGPEERYSRDSANTPASGEREQRRGR